MGGRRRIPLRELSRRVRLGVASDDANRYDYRAKHVDGVDAEAPFI